MGAGPFSCAKMGNYFQIMEIFAEKLEIILLIREIYVILHPELINTLFIYGTVFQYNTDIMQGCRL